MEVEGEEWREGIREVDMLVVAGVFFSFHDHTPSLILVARVFLFVSLTRPRGRRCFCCVLFLFVSLPAPSPWPRVFSCRFSNPLAWPQVLFVAWFVCLLNPRCRMCFWFCFSNPCVGRRCVSVRFLKPFILTAYVFALFTSHPIGHMGYVIHRCYPCSNR